MKIIELDNEIRIAIQKISLALINGHQQDKKLRAIRSKLYSDLAALESSATLINGPLSLHLYRELGSL